jgi:hypothetical protein
MLTVIVGFVGLTVDGPMGYGYQRQHHNVADAAAMAGARSLSKTYAEATDPGRRGPAIAAMTAVAAHNGVALDANAVYPTDFMGNRVSDFALAQGVEVTITNAYPTVFMRALGQPTVTVTTVATAIYGYPTGVSNVLPIQIASDAPHLGKVGETDCMAPPSGGGVGGCSTNFTPFQPPKPPCTQVRIDADYDPCFARAVKSGLPAGTQIKLGASYLSRLSPTGWGDNLSTGLKPYDYLLQRYNQAPAETWDNHAPDSPRVFFATTGSSQSGDPVVNVSNFQCVFLGKNSNKSYASGWPDAPQGGSFTVTYLDACSTAIVPGDTLQKGPSGTGPGNNRSSVVIHLIN